MEQFTERLRAHAKHVQNVAGHCDTEETTKQAMILPLLDILGYSPYDPTKVRAEYKADLPGVKKDERVDYALFSEGHPVMYIEAKASTVNLGRHASQLMRYFNATAGVCVAALTNGKEWKFFTDLQRENLMDDEPFFSLDFTNLQDSEIRELARFRHGSIQAEALRSFAEDLTYTARFRDVVSRCLKDMDPDFVRFVVSKAAPSTRLTQRAMETFSPLVHRAVAEAVGDMVRGSFAAAPAIPKVAAVEASAAPAETGQVDPDNPRIVTTKDEKRLLEVAMRLLGSRISDGELVAKDTESYYTLLFQGKTNRWLLRYNVNRRQPTVQFIMPLEARHRDEIARSGLDIAGGDHLLLESPDDLLRVPGLLFDALAFCQNDENFKRGAGDRAAEA